MATVPPVDQRVQLAWREPDQLGEGPLWDDRTQLLHRVDVLAHTVLTLDPASGQHRTYPVGQPVGCVALRRDGAGLLLALRDGFASLDLQSGEVTLLAPVRHAAVGMQLNDGGCDPAGRFLAGSISPGATPGEGVLHRFDPPTGSAAVLTGIGVSNGMAWTGDGGTLLFIDSLQRRVEAFDYDQDAGTLSGRRVAYDLQDYDGLPDGIALDAEDCLWVAFWRGGAVRRFGPDGALRDVVTLPVRRTTSCCLGGAALDTLYVTTAQRSLRAATPDAEPLGGAVFCLTVDVPGVAARRAAL